MKILKGLSVLILVLIVNIGLAQQDPMFTQYMHNEVTLNPAYAGSHKVMSFTALYRKQWAGFNGSPTTTSINAHTPLKNENIGVGLSVVNDQIGVSNNLNFYASGAYRIHLSPKANIAMGLQAGFTYLKGNLTDIKVEDQGDPVFSQDQVSGFMPNIGAGVYYENEKFYCGFSAPKLFNNDITLSDTLSLSKQSRHYFLSTGYLIEVNPLWMVKPSLMLKMVKGAAFNMDVSAHVIYDKKYWLGVATRLGIVSAPFESLDFMAMYQLNNDFRLGFAYDLVLNNLRSYNAGSFELVANYRFSYNKSKVVTPRYF